jgi:hypothetical protein
LRHRGSWPATSRFVIQWCPPALPSHTQLESTSRR